MITQQNVQLVAAEILTSFGASQWLRREVVYANKRDIVDALRDIETLKAILEARYLNLMKANDVDPEVSMQCLENNRISQYGGTQGRRPGERGYND